MYIPLNTITDYSILSSLIKVKDLVLECKKRGYKSIGISDNNLSYVMEFYNECIQNDIKPIIGYSFVLEGKKVYLYAKNYKGYQNLCYISSNEITMDTVKNNIEGLFLVLPVDSISLYDELNVPDTYIGYTDKKIDNYKCIRFDEVRVLNKEDIEYLKYLTYISEGKKIDEQIEEYSDVYLKKYELDKIEKDLFDEIYNMVDIKIEKNDLLPLYNEEPGFDNDKYLENLCKKGLTKRLNNKVPVKYAERLLYELSVIKKMGFSNYFLIVWDYVKYAKKNNILVGAGRGSAVGSLVSYSLGITDIDPLKYDLFFERFLNPERITMPDIDMDFQADKREDVINYVISKYGEKRVSNIITFSTLKSRMVLRDVARIFGMENRIDSYIKMFDRKLSLKENLNNSDIRSIYEKDTMISRITNIAIKLENIKRGRGINAAGIIISKKDLDRYIPIVTSDDIRICGYEKDYPEGLGLLKMDILAVDNLTFISNILNEIENVNINNIPLNDKKTLDLFDKAETDGIFQFETPSFKNILRKVKVDSFNDLVALIALDRPGAFNNINSYAKRKEGKEKVTYIHDDLKDILSSTYGIILYQEQIMQIAVKMASFTLGEADILRRAMSKKKTDLMMSEKEKFVNNSINNGYSKEVAESVFNYILPFAEYGFNKSHSVGYALISYQMAYLKANYRIFFMKNILNKNISDSYMIKTYINSCKLHNIEVIKPDINKSSNEFIIENNRIRFSLSSIKDLGLSVSNTIMEERKESKYKDIFNFVSRTYNKKVGREALIKLIYSGAFDLFGFNKKTLIDNLDVIINYAELSKDLDPDIIDKPEIIISEEYSKDELVKIEFQTFGFYLTNHPVQNKRKNDISTLNIKNYFNKTIDIYLMVDKKTEIITKKKEKMLFITGSDEYSFIELVIFPKTYEKFYNINKGEVYRFNVNVEKRASEYQLIVNKIEKI